MANDSAFNRFITKLGQMFATIGRAMAAAIRERRRPRVLTAPPSTCWIERSFPVTTPTREQPVNFQIRVTEWWLGHGEQDTVSANVEYFAPHKRREVKKQLRNLSRTFTPDELSDFEDRANELLKPAVFKDGLLECRYSVEVTPDEVYQSHLRNTWETVASAEVEHKLRERELVFLEPLRDRWLTFLRDLETDPLGPYAAQLAGNPSKLADVIERRALERKEQQDRLSDICNTTSNAYREMGVFDFVMETNGALATLIHYLGIDRPSTSQGEPEMNGFPSPSPNGDDLHHSD